MIKAILSRTNIMNLKIQGLEKLQRELKDAERALKALDGTVATLKFDPGDPNSVKNAIRHMETAVDNKVARYRSNELVANLAQGVKDQYRKKILELAARGKR